MVSAQPTLESGVQGSDQLDRVCPLAGADDAQRTHRRLQDLLHARQLHGCANRALDQPRHVLRPSEAE